MGRRVAIVATGQTDHVSRRTDINVAELAREGVDRCLASAGLTLADVDAFVVGNMEMFEGINMPDQWMASTLGAAGKPLFKLNTGGTVGASTAVAATQLLAAGTFRRIVSLPSALRRCSVAGAGLRDGELRVRFAPDPDLWPRTR